MKAKYLLSLTMPLAIALSGCDANRTDADDDSTQQSAAPVTGEQAQGADEMASRDDIEGATFAPAISDPEERPVMQMQVVLDRLGFTPGVVDGKMGLSTRNAIMGFQEANDLEVTGTVDDKTELALEKWDQIPATRVVTIPAAFAEGSFESIPADTAEKASMARLGYETLDEKLAERFHTTVDVLKKLNPGGKPAGYPASKPGASSPAAATPAVDTAASTAPPQASGRSVESDENQDSLFRAGLQIRVPNIGADKIEAAAVTDGNWRSTLRDLGVGTQQPKVRRIVVSKSERTLKGFDAQGKLVAMYTATMGSRHDPLPIGEWKIQGVARNPTFRYNPELFWDVPDDTEKQVLPPGPNGPVGVAWIDLSKEHYGIHGTPDPEMIGRAQSHGCIRLTNWDVARLAEMVSPSTKAIFQE